jgi:threonine/homoserine/homoserine lactone efflux protein
MGTAIGNALPFAVGVALSPIPIVAVILMLFSTGAKRVGPAFVLGWMLGVAIIGALVLLLADPANLSSDANGQSTTASVLHLILGVLLLLIGAKDWRSRPHEGDPAKLPKWMNGIDAITPGKASALAVFLSAVNPKNLVLVIGGVLAIAQADLPAGQDVIALLIFILIGSLSVLVPVVWYLRSPDRAGRTLSSWRVWMERNNAAVMSVLFLIFGVILIGKGIAGLTA